MSLRSQRRKGKKKVTAWASQPGQVVGGPPWAYSCKGGNFMRSKTSPVPVEPVESWTVVKEPIQSFRWTRSYEEWMVVETTSPPSLKERRTSFRNLSQREIIFCKLCSARSCSSSDRTEACSGPKV